MTTLINRNLKEDADIRYYLSALPLLSQDYSGINPFWDEILKEFKSLLLNCKSDSFKTFEVEILIRKLNSAPNTGYLLEPLRENSSLSDELNFKKALKLSKRLKKRPWNLTYKLGIQDHFFPKAIYEHAIGLAYLKSCNLLKSYIEFLDSLSIKSNYITTRYFSYLYILESLINEHYHKDDDIDILEIGSGSANLALFLKKRLKITRYFFVDLPEMILLAIYAMKSYFYEKNFCILDSAKKVNDISNSDLIFVPAQFVHLIPQRAANVTLNTHSFQEMDKNVRDNYFTEIYRICRKNSIFFNVNWFQKKMTRLDGDTYDNNPLQYPYTKTSRILIWEEDPFQGYLRRVFNYKNTTSLSILYAGLFE